jgi:hypothetical protein
MLSALASCLDSLQITDELFIAFPVLKTSWLLAQRWVVLAFGRIA